MSMMISILVFPPQSFPQPADDPAYATPLTVSKEQSDGLLSAVETDIRDCYVFPEKIPHIVELLEAARRAGRYADVDNRLLAQRLSEDLLAGSGDHHLYLIFDPQRFALAVRPAATDAGDAYERRAALRDNSGVSELTIFPGNIRYLKISQFEWVPDESGAVYDDAMRFLRGADALIIDLRGNPGGDSAAVRYLVSHFIEPDTLEYSFLEGSKPPLQMRALDYLPTGRIRNKPLYVLIDGGVASAAESFAYDVQQFKLGDLVGERTVGAANNNRLVPIAAGFMLSVSYGRPVHAVSGTNWEGIGVAPTVSVAARDALDEAQRLALKRLEAQPDSSSRESASDYAWALVAVESRLRPVKLPTGRLKSLEGHYGDIDIRFGRGQLWLARPNRPIDGLTPLAANGLFSLEGTDRIRVQLTGSKLEMYWKGDPSPRVFARASVVGKQTTASPR